MPTPVASVIISTYNQPDWLERCLWGYAQQDRLDFELLVADDGSREQTRQRILYLASTPLIMLEAAGAALAQCFLHRSRVKQPGFAAPRL